MGRRSRWIRSAQHTRDFFYTITNVFLFFSTLSDAFIFFVYLFGMDCNPFDGWLSANYRGCRESLRRGSCYVARRGRRAARHTAVWFAHGRAKSSRKERDSTTRANARQHHSRLSDVPRVAFNSPSTYSAINDSHHRPRLWPLPSLWPWTWFQRQPHEAYRRPIYTI